MVTACSLLIMSGAGAFNPVSADERINRLAIGTAAAIGVVATAIAILIDRSLWDIAKHMAAISGPPDFGVPILHGMPKLTLIRVSADEWTQPEPEEGDRLIEGEQLDLDGVERPIVLLVKANGEVHGYSRALDGHGVHLVLDNRNVDDLPADPGASDAP